LGFESYVDEGELLKISKAKVEGKLSNSNYNILLKDNVLNITHDLNVSDYQFTINEKGVFNNRFELIIDQSTLAVAHTEMSSNNLIIKNSSDHLSISTSNSSVVSKFRAYDILGKILFDETPNSNQVSVYTGNINKGTIIIINTVLEDQQVLFKKIIIN
jgi:hypothetical protein